MKSMLQVCVLLLVAVGSMEIAKLAEIRKLAPCSRKVSVASCGDNIVSEGTVCKKDSSGSCTTYTQLYHGTCSDGSTFTLTHDMCQGTTENSPCSGQPDLKAYSNGSEAFGPNLSCPTYTSTPCSTVQGGSGSSYTCPDGGTTTVTGLQCVPGTPTTPKCGNKPSSVGVSC